MSIESRVQEYAQRMGSWQVRKMLGRGSGGKTIVFELYRDSLGFEETAALKVVELACVEKQFSELSPEEQAGYLSFLQNAKKKAAQEVQLMYRLSGNTNIVDYRNWDTYQWVEDASFGCDFLILMEQLECLEDKIRSGWQLSEDEIKKLGCDMCSALGLLQHNSIVHRDIKPHNIFFNTAGSYKLGDLGISRVLEENPELQVITSHGTYAYAAPEQIRGQYDHRTDIYSLGLVLYELGNRNKLPFASSSYFRESNIARRLQGEPLPMPDNVQPALGKIILKACSPNPADRYQTAAELRYALESLSVSESNSWKPQHPATETETAPFWIEETISLLPDPDRQRRLSELETAAKNGDPAAQTELAAILLENATPESTVVAVEWLKKAVAQEYAPALAELGALYLFGIGVEKSEKQAITYFRAGVRKGNADAMGMLGMCYAGGIGRPTDPEQAALWIEKAAKEGNASAQYDLGLFYTNGFGVEKCQVTAADWYQKAAQQGYADAQYALGLLCRDGIGTETNAKEAAAWFQKAAEQGHLDSIASFAECFLEADSSAFDPKRAAALLQMGAEHDNAKAQIGLGYCFSQGIGVIQDDSQMFYWFRKAAEQGDSDGQVHLANCYWSGCGTEKNPEQAAFWARKAAEQNSPEGQFILCTLYGAGVGVPKDTEQAIMWCRKAAAQNHPEAIMALASHYLLGEGVPKDTVKAFELFKFAAELGVTQAIPILLRLAREGIVSLASEQQIALWMQQAAELSDPFGQFEIGNCFYYGNGVSQNLPAAVQWYQKAASQGIAEAQEALAWCYTDGKGVANDDRLAFVWFEAAAEQGSHSAMLELGNSFYNGSGVEKNREKAMVWYQKAAEAGNACAMNLIGQFHAAGRYIEKDEELAFIWFRKAAQMGHPDGMQNLSLCYRNGIGCQQNISLATEWLQKARNKVT